MGVMFALGRRSIARHAEQDIVSVADYHVIASMQPCRTKNRSTTRGRYNRCAGYERGLSV